MQGYRGCANQRETVRLEREGTCSFLFASCNYIPLQSCFTLQRQFVLVEVSSCLQFSWDCQTHLYCTPSHQDHWLRPPLQWFGSQPHEILPNSEIAPVIESTYSSSSTSHIPRDPSSKHLCFNNSTLFLLFSSPQNGSCLLQWLCPWVPIIYLFLFCGCLNLVMSYSLLSVKITAVRSVFWLVPDRYASPLCYSPYTWLTPRLKSCILFHLLSYYLSSHQLSNPVNFLMVSPNLFLLFHLHFHSSICGPQ